MTATSRLQHEIASWQHPIAAELQPWQVKQGVVPVQLVKEADRELQNR